jgi:hypothetical protein
VSPCSRRRFDHLVERSERRLFGRSPCRESRPSVRGGPLPVGVLDESTGSLGA